LLLAAQYVLFRQHAQREVVWTFPQNFDQNTYLALAYKTYEYTHLLGPVQGHWRCFREGFPTGIMLPFQASLLFELTGPSRLSALTLNFAYFALLQVVLVGVLRHLSGRWSVALLGLGLLLTANTPFLDPGGMMDFRLDFIASCLLGVFLCLVLRSGVFASWPWSIASGGAAALLVLFRFLTFVYLAAIFGVLLLFLAGRLWYRRRDAGRRRLAARQLIGLALAGVCLLGLTLPVLWYHRAGIWKYYVLNHVTGKEKEVRAAECGVHSLRDALLFYPKSVWSDHTRGLFRVLSVLAVLAALGLTLYRRRARKSAPLARPLDRTTAFLFLVLCLVVPYAVLTVNVAKSPVVGSILVPPLLGLVLLPITLAAARWQPKSSAAVTGVLAGLAVLALGAGFAKQGRRLGGRTEMSRHRELHEREARLFDAIGRHCKRMKWAPLRVSITTLGDWVYPGAATPLIYEHEGYYLETVLYLGRDVLAVTEGRALAYLQESDFVIFTEPKKRQPFAYPFERSMRQLRPRLKAYCAQHFALLETLRLSDGEKVEIYVRPALPRNVARADAAAKRR
jgi:hypothetical protein